MRHSMRRVVLGLVTMLSLCVCAEEKPDGSAVLNEQIRNLGADKFRERVAASKLLTARVQAVDAQIMKYLENGKGKNEDDSSAKDTQNAVAGWGQFYEGLESAHASNEDPEVKSRLAEVLKTGRFSAAFFELSPKAMRLAMLPFETYVNEDGRSVSRKTYGKEGFGITDLGNIRIVRKGLASSGTGSSSRIYIQQYSGSSSSSSGSGSRRFNYTTRGGVTTVEWGDALQFTMSNGVLTIGGRDIPFSKTPKVVFVSEKNKVTAVIKVRPAAK